MLEQMDDPPTDRMNERTNEQVDVAHPAAKSMIELSRAQDEEVGDGTTSVIILSEFLRHCLSLPSPFFSVRFLP